MVVRGLSPCNITPPCQWSVFCLKLIIIIVGNLNFVISKFESILRFQIFFKEYSQSKIQPEVLLPTSFPKIKIMIHVMYHIFTFAFYSSRSQIYIFDCCCLHV